MILALDLPHMTAKHNNAVQSPCVREKLSLPDNRKRLPMHADSQALPDHKPSKASETAPVVKNRPYFSPFGSFYRSNRSSVQVSRLKTKQKSGSLPPAIYRSTRYHQRSF